MSRETSIVDRISGQLYRALEDLGADNQLLVTVGSWIEGENDDDTYAFIKAYNDSYKSYHPELLECQCLISSEIDGTKMRMYITIDINTITTVSQELNSNNEISEDSCMVDIQNGTSFTVFVPYDKMKSIWANRLKQAAKWQL
jgi:hypothetical protein